MQFSYSFSLPVFSKNYITSYPDFQVVGKLFTIFLTEAENSSFSSVIWGKFDYND